MLEMYVQDKTLIPEIVSACNGDIDTVYELIGFDTVSSFLKRVREKNSPFMNPVFDTHIERESSIDSFVSNPVDVVEGALTCPKCRSTRTFTYTKQVRSGDEGTSVFGVCASCTNKWRES